jgi:hypothetical protein
MKEGTYRCKFVSEQGKQCGGYALRDDPDQLCFFHSESTKEERTLAAKKGGLVRKGDLGRTLEINNGVDVMTLLNQTINAAKSGKIDSKVANSIFYGLNIMLKAIEICKLEQKLEEIQEGMKIRQAKGYQDADIIDLID